MNDSAVLLASDLAWPLVVLIIAVIILLSQRHPIGDLIGRIRSLRYPGGEAQLANALPESDADTIRSLVELLPENLRDSMVREETPAAPAGGQPAPIQNREPLGEFEPLPAGEVTNLVMLRTKLANILAELAFPPPPDGLGPTSVVIDQLRQRGVLNEATAQALHRVVEIADRAASGAQVPHVLAEAVRNSGQAILEQLGILQTAAPAMFEDHVLATLRMQRPADWLIDVDAPVRRGPDTDRPARVDALVSVAGKAVVAEVRARLRSGAHGQIDALRDWFQALPAALPVLLIVLGEGLRRPELDQLTAGRPGPVRMLRWDTAAARLVPELRELLDSATESAQEPATIS